MLKKILIVEDEPIIAADLMQELQSMSYDVLDTLESGEEAIEFVKQHRPDIMLVDINLEGHLDGIDAVQEILKTNDIPVIFLTSSTDQKSFARAKLTQPCAFLSKPYKKLDLKHSIELAISQIDDDVKSDDINQDEIWFNDRIFIRTKDWMLKIKVEDLLYIEAEGCYCTLKTKDKSHTIISTLKKFSEQVQNKELLRVHRSYIVNLDAIDKFSDQYISIKEKVIPIGKTYKLEVMKKFRRI